MKHKVIIQPPALADIEGAYRYIHERAPTRAPDWLDKLYEAMESLEELPKRCSRLRATKWGKTFVKCCMESGAGSTACSSSFSMTR